MEADSKKKRGRPTVYEREFGESAAEMKAAVTGLTNYDSERSRTNEQYYMEGYKIAKAYLKDKDTLRATFFTKAGNHKGKTVLEQIGRMKLQNGYTDNYCEIVLQKAIEAMEQGVTVKHIERWIRNGRNKGHFEALEAASNIYLTGTELIVASECFKILRELMATAIMEREQNQQTELTQCVDRHEVDPRKVITALLDLERKVNAKID